MSDEIEVPSAPKTHPIATVLTTVVLPVVIVGIGLVCTGMLFATRTGPERTVTEAVIAEVVVREIKPTTRNANVQGTGQVRAAQQVRLTSQVQGSVVRIADKLAPGSRFRKGEVLATLDGRDYRAGVAAQEQAVAQAELQLAIEQNRAMLAEKEWARLGKGGKASDLTLRKPYLKAAEKGLEAAMAALMKANANLGRTQIKAPFNGVVIEESVEVGQLVGPTAAVATLVGTDAFWVDVSMPVEKLDGITFPGNGQPGSVVEITQMLGAGRTIERQGRVVQLGGTLDPQSRTATVLVEIPNPYEVEGLPMLPGAHVTVGIDGRALQDTWEIDRSVVDSGRYVWVVDQESSLRKRELTIGWRSSDTVIATGGLHSGDRVVVSALTLPVDGQAVVAVGEEG